MTAHVEPPTTYRHWTGHAVAHPEKVELDRTWPNPAMWREDNGIYWHERYPLTERLSAWRRLGWAPSPRSRWEWFWHTYHHGRLMRYPRLSVIVFALRMQWLAERT